MVTRTSKVSEANMILENATFEQTLKVTLPAPKKRKTTNLTWEREEMPSVPIPSSSLRAWPPPPKVPSITTRGLISKIHCATSSGITVK